MTHIMPKYRVAITPTTENDLHALRYAFEGKMAHGEHQECRDDVLVAALLGWHLRKIAPLDYGNIKSVVQEFYTRVSETAPDWMEAEEIALRKNSRGVPSTPGNVLTIDGIDNKTLARIEARAHAVKRMLIKLEDMVHNQLGEVGHQSLNKLLAGYSDQAIMDLTVWFVLSLSVSSVETEEEYPHWVKDEIQARGQARADYEAGLLDGEAKDNPEGFPVQGCGDIDISIVTPVIQTPVSLVAEELPPLTSRDRRAFFMRRRIQPTEGFWTDGRIRAAVRMGL